jgi:hypothetical protein
MKKILSFIFVFSLIFIQAAVFDGQSVKAAQIHISKKTMSLTADSYDYIALKGADRKKVKWSTSNKSVATVFKDSDNVLTYVAGHKAGTATITARYNGKSYTCKVTVTKKAARVYISKKKMSLTVDSYDYISLKGAARGKVKWSTSNKSVVTVFNDNKNILTYVVGHKAGTATITARYNGKSYTCKVTVKK